jgi:hypothetical protein
VRGAVALIATLTAVGAGLGMVVAGPIVSLLSYHWLFCIPMIVTTGAAGAAYLLVPESPQRSPGRISWLPALLLSAWLVALLLALSEAPKWGWGLAKVIALFGTAVLLAGGWIASELHAASPLIDMHMMRRRAVWTNNLVASSWASGCTRSSRSCRNSCRPGSRWLRLHRDHRVWQLYVAESVMGIGFSLVFAAMSGLIVHAALPAQTGARACTQPGRSDADVEGEPEHPALAVVAAGTVVGDKPE